MDNQQLVEYIKQSRQQGLNDNQIRQSLLSAGWAEHDIQAALALTSIQTPVNNEPAIDQDQFSKKWSWGAFFLPSWIYLLASRQIKK